MTERFSRWDAADYLETEEDMALYLDACLEEDLGDGSLVRAALKDIARARGMSQLARDTGLTREGLLPCAFRFRQPRVFDGAQGRQGAVACLASNAHEAAPNAPWQASQRTGGDFVTPVLRHGGRCPWCGTDPLYVAYHDTEWGVPCHDERRLFEFLILEGMQAGLSWLTILRKRENFRRALDGFDPEMIARYDEHDIARLMADPGIVRNRLKIEAAIGNARATLALHESGASLDELLWQAAAGRPIVNHWRTPDEVPVFTPAAESLSKQLSQRGFRFVGPTVIYSLMQATGMVNDHLVTCPRYREVMRG